MRKRIISFITALSMVMGMMPVQAFATTPKVASENEQESPRFQIETSVDEVAEGESLTVTISLTDDIQLSEDITNVQGEIHYDSDVFRYVSHEFSAAYSAYQAEHMAEKSQFQFSRTDLFADAFELSAGEVVEVTFKAKETIPDDQVEATFCFESKLTTSDGSTVKSDVDTTVTAVKAEESEEPSFIVKLNKAQVKAGERFEATIRLSATIPASADITNVQGELHYDTDALTYVSHQFSPAYSSYEAENMVSKNRFQFSRTDEQAEAFEVPAGEIVTVTFEAKEDVAAEQVIDFDFETKLSTSAANTTTDNIYHSVVVVEEEKWDDSTEPSFRMEADSDSVLAGEKFTVLISLDETIPKAANISNIQGELYYNTELVSYDSHTFAAAYSTYMAKNMPNRARFSFSRTDMFADSFEIPVGDVISVTFTAKEGLSEHQLEAAFRLEMKLTTVDQKTTIVKANESVLVKEHTWNNGEITLAETCIAEGVKTYSCTYEGCGASKTETVAKDPANHTGNNHIEGTVEETCAKDGYSGDVVCECGVKVADGEVIPASGKHNYTVEGIKTPATCMATGSVVMQCANCEATIVETLPKDPANHTGNNHTEGAVEETCAKDGYSGDVVCECGVKVADGEVIPASGKHNYTVEGNKTPATCMATGFVVMQCANCEATIVKTLPKDPANHTGNNHTEGAVEETCAKDGYSGDVVCECGVKVADGEVIPANGNHIRDDGYVHAKPTCVENGYKGFACQNCGSFMGSEVIPATGHSDANKDFVCDICGEDLCTNHKEEIIPAVEATCTASGLTEGKHCSVCGAIIVAQEVVPAKGHVEVTDKAVEATCTATGLTEGKHCSVCGEIIAAQEVVPAKGHVEVVDKAVEATCTATGLTEGKHCSVCGEIIVAQEVVPAKGHVEVTDKAVEATCTASGLTEGKHCSVCGEIIVAQEVVPVKGHVEVTDKAVEATCTASGLTEGKHCAVCGEIIAAQEVVPAKGHSYDNGKCTDCGQEADVIVIDGVSYWANAGKLYYGNSCVGAVKDDKITMNNGDIYEKDSDGNWVEEDKVPSASRYTVKAEAGLNGKISPEGSFEVKEGKDKTFRITANEGFVIDMLTVDGKVISKAAGKESYTLTLEDIDEDYRIKVSFVKKAAPSAGDKVNPSTGADAAVSAAAAFALLSIMGAAAISGRK